MYNIADIMTAEIVHRHEPEIASVRLDVSRDGTAIISDVLGNGGLSTVYRFDNPLLERRASGSVASQKDNAITRARELDVPFTQIDHGLIDKVLNAKAAEEEFAQNSQTTIASRV